eukprot:583487-Lingulodinium_polyedra.AAC.1
MELCRPSDARAGVEDEVIESSADPGASEAAGSSAGPGAPEFAEQMLAELPAASDLKCDRLEIVVFDGLRARVTL